MVWFSVNFVSLSSYLPNHVRVCSRCLDKYSKFQFLSVMREVSRLESYQLTLCAYEWNTVELCSDAIEETMHILSNISKICYSQSTKRENHIRYSEVPPTLWFIRAEVYCLIKRWQWQRLTSSVQTVGSIAQDICFLWYNL